MAIVDVEPMSIDQLAGSVVLFLGAVGSLLLVIWQSKCHCKVNLCYLFMCERRPPNEDEMRSLKDQSQKLKEKAEDVKNNNKKSVEIDVDDESILPTPKELKELNLQNP